MTTGRYDGVKTVSMSNNGYHLVLCSCYSSGNMTLYTIDAIGLHKLFGEFDYLTYDPGTYILTTR